MGKDAASNQSISVPVLLPGPKHIVETQLLSVDPQGRAGQILVMLYTNHPSGNAGAQGSGTQLLPVANSVSQSCSPLLSAAVKMPACELIN